ncbi:MAG: terminase small subunit [Limosilactobacillus sp.]|nr:terminase small subunit [Limosilactobacillus sp.]
MKLTLKQMKFANEYIESGNATQAYLMAYKNVKKEEVARANASRLLTNANVKSYIDERMKKIEGDKIMSLTEIIQRLSEFGRGEAIEEQAMMDPVSGNPTIVKVKVKATTQLSAMRELLKRYPQSDELMNAQVRKAKAEADIAEYQAQQITNTASDVTKITVVDDIPKEEGADDDNDKS